MCKNLVLALLFVFAAAPLPAEQTVGQSIGLKGILVTLLDARRLSLEEYRDAHPVHPVDWAGGGFRFTFLVENRPGAALPAALGEVRVILGSKLYNPVTNANSRQPFRPLIVVRGPDDFFAGGYGGTLRARVPLSPRATGAVVLEIFVPGSPVAAGVAGVVELEQGETYRPDGNGTLRALRPDEIAKTGSGRDLCSPRLIEVVFAKM